MLAFDLLTTRVFQLIVLSLLLLCASRLKPFFLSIPLSVTVLGVVSGSPQAAQATMDDIGSVHRSRGVGSSLVPVGFQLGSSWVPDCFQFGASLVPVGFQFGSSFSRSLGLRSRNQIERAISTSTTCGHLVMLEDSYTNFELQQTVASSSGSSSTNTFY